MAASVTFFVPGLQHRSTDATQNILDQLIDHVQVVEHSDIINNGNDDGNDDGDDDAHLHSPRLDGA